ncbi:MAG: hypothetical protein IJK27_03145 [Bacilli bacterium]|nr:hypothetical protein [Bacilli bacterium]
MSEIKGQLLGIILTISIFLTVSAALTGVFATMNRSVQNHVDQIAEVSETSTQNNG